MAYDPIASRYAHAAFESAKTTRQVDELLEQLTHIAGLCREHENLRRLLYNPDVDPPEKVAILQRLMKGSWSDLLRAFLLMVVEAGRAEFLPQIAEAFLAEVDADRGRLRVVVRSARPLPEETMARLRALLEHRERKQILVETQTAPELIAGVQLMMGHRVVDGSVRRQLVNLRERLSTVRVY